MPMTKQKSEQLESGLWVPDWFPGRRKINSPKEFMFTPGASGCAGSGCGCDVWEKTCSGCAQKNAPRQVSVVLRGFSSTGCDSCGSLNGTYVLNFSNEIYCNYIYTLPNAICDVKYIWFWINSTDTCDPGTRFCVMLTAPYGSEQERWIAGVGSRNDPASDCGAIAEENMPEVWCAPSSLWSYATCNSHASATADVTGL